jgi:hypothetical protein
MPAGFETSDIAEGFHRSMMVVADKRWRALVAVAGV